MRGLLYSGSSLLKERQITLSTEATSVFGESEDARRLCNLMFEIRDGFILSFVSFYENTKTGKFKFI